MKTGNMLKEKFINIWSNDKFSSARKRLLNKDRNISPCNKCDVSGTFMGHTHAKVWQEIK